MTAYVKNVTSGDKNFFFKIFYSSRGTSFSMTVMPRNDFERVEKTHFGRKLQKAVFLGQKCRHMSKMRRQVTKIFSKIFNSFKGNNFFYYSYARKRLQKGVNDSFLPKFAKKMSFGPNMASYVKNVTSGDKNCFSKYSTQGKQRFLWQLRLKTTIKGSERLFFAEIR